MSTDLKDHIIKYIVKNAPVTMDTIIDVAKDKGFTEADILTTLDVVHKDKRITYTANASGVVLYKTATTKVATTPSYLTWWHENYPAMTPDSDGSGIDIDLSFLFMKPEQAKEYKAQAKGLPVHMVKQYGTR